MTQRRKGAFTSPDAPRAAPEEPEPSEGQSPEPTSPRDTRSGDLPPERAEGSPVAARDFLDAETANAFLRLSAEGFMVVDGEGMIRYANRRMCSLFGYGRTDLLGRTLDLILPGLLGDLRGGAAAHGSLSEGCGAVKKELAARRADGSTFPAEIRIGPPPPAGRPGMLCIVEDRSERRGAEELLELTESRFETLFRASPSPTFVWQHRDDDFYLMDFNDAGSGGDDASIQHLLGRSLHEVYPEGCAVVDHIRQCFTERAQLVREVAGYRMRATADVKDLLVTYVFVAPDIVLAFTEDLTTKRSFERDLRKLSSAVEQTADTVFITDRSGIIEYVNPAFERTTGFSRDEAVGNTPRILKSGFQDTEYYERLWGAILGGESFHAPVINRKKSGELYHAEQTITPMKDAEGRITHFVSVLRDMTETIRLREQETESNLARKVQRRLFPSEPPRLDGFELAGGVYPAAATCGDYFDFIPMAAGRLGVVVADACGHGMGPALMMAETRAYLRTAAPTESDPYDVLVRLHSKLLADLDDRDYVTMILACLDPESRRLHYASAGHVSAFVLDPTGALRRELHSTGRPLGAVPDLAMVRAEPLPLASGDVVVFLTDGILEATDRDDNEFGRDRTLDVVARNRGASSREIVERLHDEVLIFAGRSTLPDDLTAVVCRVL